MTKFGRVSLRVCLTLAVCCTIVCEAQTTVGTTCPSDALTFRSCADQKSATAFNQCLGGAIEWDISQLELYADKIGVAKASAFIAKSATVTLQGQNVILSDLLATGGGQSKITNVNLTAQGVMEGSQLEVVYTHTIPNFKLTAKYAISGKPSGTATLTISNYQTSFDLTARLVKGNDGNLYLLVTSASSKIFGVGSFDLKFSGLPANDPLNSNSQAIIDAVKDALIKVQDPSVLSWLNSIYLYFPPINQWLAPAGGTSTTFCVRKANRSNREKSG